MPSDSEALAASGPSSSECAVCRSSVRTSGSASSGALACPCWRIRVASRFLSAAASSQGACFVRFADLAGAGKAQKSLHMRQFDGNTVTATFIDSIPV